MKTIILLCLAVMLSVLPACNRAPEEEAAVTGHELTAFEFRQSGPGPALLVTGAAAQVAEAGGVSDTRVSSPGAVIETDVGWVIHMTTAEDGSGELTFDPDTSRISEILLRRGVELVAKNAVTGATEMRARGEEMRYDYGRREFLITGQPVVYRDRNEFRGRVIRYLVEEGRIFIEGGASGVIHHGERPAATE